ncbi:3-isopropylmalate dehydratase small subunit [Aestuariibius sp. HNIBRBA575]|uniref:3-isopropylmalate dehydratase small subunit n=1 Tax=Aestuariibius sp. HNIBRBA575 TaxID=3233343 RepID=UPI0034A59925
MEKFSKVTGIAAPMPWDNVNTDMISPKHVMKAVKKTGLAWGFFQEYRFGRDGAVKPDFVLNKAPWDKASIIVSLENWGCGSSREHAPWAMRDYGIRSVIALSFADIHYNNCFKNGILPVRLPVEELNRVMQAAEAGEAVTVDLTTCQVTLADGTAFGFEVDAVRRDALLNGQDEIDQTKTQMTEIEGFEARHRRDVPWLFDRHPKVVAKVEPVA